MKKLLIPLLTGFCVSLAPFTNAESIKCDDLLNSTWKGNFGNLTNVYFYMNGHPNDIWGSVNFSYDEGSGHVGLDALQGSCVENSDGTATIILKRTLPGVSGNITAKAKIQNELEVTSFNYSDPWDHFSGTGILKK